MCHDMGCHNNSDNNDDGDDDDEMEDVDEIYRDHFDDDSCDKNDNYNYSALQS